jgi:tetrahydromethanopterin S-methyltransferase subunit G
MPFLEAENMTGMPVFVKIDEYKDVLDVLGLLNKKLERAREIIEKLNELKAEEDAELEIWQKELSEVEKKLEFMNHTLVEPNM